MDFIVTASGLLEFCGRRVDCVLGRSGITNHKPEGDGATPAGCFAFRRILFRADRIDRPASALPMTPISPNDGWCDDLRDPAYNRPVRLPYSASAEALWRDDGVYDIIVVLGQNDDPPVPGSGSAIFMHIARANGAPTQGCVAMPQPDLLALIGAFSPGDRLCVNPDLA
jgi:L,D-peptidoglycan transpeptidase YkuD (ErfK/YbiS/YcfS/YnhG family)